MLVVLRVTVMVMVVVVDRLTQSFNGAVHVGWRRSVFGLR